ncbi:hypothetical protein GCM10025771_10780 [Niveibacterium umoris]|uniref:Uncharacterized protein n=1 Tax=Niveibacterium umoris TaxID=1193620 RepID=A0A840BIK3_9RHOO|nr:hypothetical protein [Niveibacterium umoris]MBB4013371.1 hypothetical protein [Niveibacterium umoris]
MTDVGRLRERLAELRGEPRAIDSFLSDWRAGAAALCARLPPRFAEVSQDLLTRLESSRLFSGDACAFSRDDLLDAFAVWLDKAEARLDAGG